MIMHLSDFVLLLNTLWFGGAFIQFSVAQGNTLKILVPREERGNPIAPTLSASVAFLGAINLPIIHYSVLWWRTLHQGQSIGVSGSSIDSSILWPLPLAALGFTCLFGAAVLMRMRAELAEAKVEARMRRAATE